MGIPDYIRDQPLERRRSTVGEELAPERVCAGSLRRSAVHAGSEKKERQYDARQWHATDGFHRGRPIRSGVQYL
jgi:hypothetical protein